MFVFKNNVRVSKDRICMQKRVIVRLTDECLVVMTFNDIKSNRAEKIFAIQKNLTNKVRPATVYSNRVFKLE